MIKSPKNSSIQSQLQMMAKLIQNLKNTNNFGYKLIKAEQYKILSNWYSTIHGKEIVIEESNVQFFPNSTIMFVYLVLGLTSEGDQILSINLCASSIETTIKEFNRNLLTLDPAKILVESNSKNQVNNFLTEFQNKIKTCKLLILSNPDTIFTWPQNIVHNLIQICKKYDTFVIVDERKADFCVQFNSMLGLNQNNLVVMRELGSLINNDGIKKYMCVFGSSQVKNKRIALTQVKSLKILPGDLTIQLIHIFMGEQALKLHGIMIRNLSQNPEYLKKQLTIKQKISKYLVLPQKYHQIKAILDQLPKILIAPFSKL